MLAWQAFVSVYTHNTCVNARIRVAQVFVFVRISFGSDSIFCARAAEQHPSRSGCRTLVLRTAPTS